MRKRLNNPPEVRVGGGWRIIATVAASAEVFAEGDHPGSEAARDAVIAAMPTAASPRIPTVTQR